MTILPILAMLIVCYLAFGIPGIVAFAGLAIPFWIVTRFI